jgi:hypothetical protein
MSQQVAAGQGARCGGRRKLRYIPQGGGVDLAVKGYKSSILEIAQDTFYTDHNNNKFVAQFTKWRKNIANYIQCLLAAEGYLVVQTVQTSRQQTISLPPPIDTNKNGCERSDYHPSRRCEVSCKEATETQGSPKEGL